MGPDATGEAGNHIYVYSSSGLGSARNIITNNHFIDYTASAINLAGSSHFVSNNQFRFLENSHALANRVEPHVRIRTGSYECTVIGNTYLPQAAAPGSTGFVANVVTDSGAYRTQVLDIGGSSALRYAQQNSGADGAVFSVSQSQLDSSTPPVHVGQAPEGLYSNWWYYDHPTWYNRGFSVSGQGIPNFLTKGLNTSGSNPTLDSKTLQGWLEVVVNGNTYHVPLYQ